VGRAGGRRPLDERFNVNGSVTSPKLGHMVTSFRESDRTVAEWITSLRGRAGGGQRNDLCIWFNTPVRRWGVQSYRNNDHNETIETSSYGARARG